MREEYEFGFDPTQLLLPLQTPLQVYDLPEVALPRKTIEVEEVEIEWSDEHIETLHLCLLEDAFSHLRNPQTCIDNKRELLDWINAPYIRSMDIDKHPFSFQLCCRFAGYDAETVSEGINDRFRNTDVLR